MQLHIYVVRGMQGKGNQKDINAICKQNKLTRLFSDVRRTEIVVHKDIWSSRDWHVDGLHSLTGEVERHINKRGYKQCNLSILARIQKRERQSIRALHSRRVETGRGSRDRLVTARLILASLKGH